MSRRVVVLALGCVVSVGVLPASATSPRTDRQVYIAAGGASAGPAGSLYESRSQHPYADNAGQARSSSKTGEKSVNILVLDGSGSPVAARIEGYRGDVGFVFVSCNATKVEPLRLQGITELRVTPFVGLCSAYGTPNTMSLPTSGEVIFTFNR